MVYRHFLKTICCSYIHKFCNVPATYLCFLLSYFKQSHLPETSFSKIVATLLSLQTLHYVVQHARTSFFTEPYRGQRSRVIYTLWRHSIDKHGNQEDLQRASRTDRILLHISKVIQAWALSVLLDLILLLTYLLLTYLLDLIALSVVCGLYSL